jgi:hypothetical protein
MTFKITSYTGEVKGLRRGGPGRATSDLTLALQSAIAASAADGKPRKWEGAAAEYIKNAQKIRAIAYHYTTPTMPNGFSLSVGLDGKDLTFSAKPKQQKDQATPEPPKVEATKPTAKKPTKRAAAATK